MRLKQCIFALVAMLLCAFSATAQVTTEAALKDALATGGEVTLGADIEVTEMIEVPTGVEATLDLNGHAITSGYQTGSDTKHIYPLDVYGDLTIKDTKGDGSITGRGIYVQTGCKLTVDGGYIYGIDVNGGSALFQYGGDIVINGGHIEQKATGTTNFAVNAAGGTVEVNGGWVGGNHGAIAAFNDAVVTIDDGTFVCTGTAGMSDNVLYTSGNGSITINGGKFIGDSDGPSGGCCIYDSNGKTTVNGGSFSNSSGGDVWGTTGTTINGGTFENLIETQHVAVGATITNGGKTYTKAEDGTMEETTFVAKIGSTTYATFAEALTAASAMSGDVTVEVYDKVTLNTAFSGSYSSINFVGKDTDAEIYLDVQGYITATGKKVSFTDLKLSKSAGGYMNNAGFMNVAFGIYDVTEVAYTNCVFANGAYASSGNVTFNDCTFYRSHDKYGLWAYGDVNATVEDCTFADYRGIKMYAEGAAKTVDLTVKNTDFSAVTDKPAIVLTYGESVVLEGNTYSSTGTFELDLDGAPNGTTVTSDVAPTCKNDNGTCGVLVDGKIYTTVAQAVEVAAEGSNVTLLYSTTDAAEFAEGVNLTLANGVTADNVTVATSGVAKIGDTTYATLAEAVAAAQAGDEIVLLGNAAENVTLPAGVKFNGNGKAVGNLTAGGEITFTGVTKATSFGVQYTNTTVNIVPGACLEITGTGRMVIGHGCTFNITGSIEDAKTADVADLTPSLIIPGASFTGAGVTFNVTNAYISAPSSYCSSSSSASGTFDFNFTNSIWESAGKLAFESQSTAATVNFDLVESVLNTGSHLVFGVSRGEVVIDNSNVNVGTSRQIENQSTMTIKNGAVVNGAVATSSNAKNPGTIIVENATYAVTGEFSGSDLGTGTLIVKKGATVSAGSITKANIQIDATGMAAGDEINLTANLSNLAGTIEVINNNNLDASIVDGKIVLAVKPVAMIGETAYATLAEAISAAQAGETVKVFEGTYAVPAMKAGITIEGVGNVLFEGTLSGTLENLTLKNLHIKGGNAQRWAYAKGDLVFENVTFEATSVYALHFDGITEGTNLTYKNCTIIGWAAMSGSPASCVFDGCTIKDNGTYGVIRTYFDATIENCTFDVANAKTDDEYQDGIHAVSGAEITVNGCTNVNGEMKDLVNVSGASVVSVDGVEIKNVAQVGETKYTDLQEAIKAAAPAGTVELLSDVTVDEWIMFSETLTIGNGDIITTQINGLTINGNGKTVTIKDIESAGNGARLFYDATNLNINNLTFNFVDNAANLGGIGLTAGTIENVTFNGGGYAIFPGTGAVIIEGCTFKTNATSIYYEEARDNLVVTGNTFENPDNVNVILLRGNTTFTDNNVISGRTVNVVSGSPVVTGNNFNDVRFKVYNVATATIENNTINTLAFNDESVVNSTFDSNTLSAEAQAVLDAANFPAVVAKVGDVEYTSLQAALDAAVAGTGNVTVEILADVNLTGIDWNPVTVSGPGYPLVTVEGNDKTITGLNDMLFAGTWAGKSGLIIKDLTIANSAIVNDKDDAATTVGVGAFIGFPQASAIITLENCHLKNSSVEGGHWTGGLIGYAAGYAGEDGPVFMNLTIEGCSVTGSTITGKGSVGGIIGHGSGNGWTNVVIEETTVENNTITSTGSSTNKAGAVMGTIGAAGQPTTANGVTKTGGASVSATVAGNTVTSNGTEITTIYGRQGTSTGLLYVAGGSYDNYPIEQGVAYAAPIEGYEIVENADGTYGIELAPTDVKVATLAELQAALADNSNELPIIITETIVIPEGETVVLDLNGKTVTHQDEATKYAINNLGTLTIQDTKGNGSINARGIYNGYGNGGANVATAKITVLSGTINAKGTDGGAAIFNYGVADIQGGNFTSIGGYSLNNQSGASMTIAAGVTANNGIYANGATLVVNGGEINGNRSGCHVLYAWNSNVTIAGGTFHNNNSGNSTTMAGGTTKLTINGGTFSIANGKSTNGWTSCLIDATDGGKYEINGGEFKGHFRVQANCAMEINGGTFENTHGEAYVNGGTVAVKGGTFTDAAAQKFATDNLVAGYELDENGTVVQVNYVAKIGEQGYATLSAAFAAVTDDAQTVVVLQDVTEELTGAYLRGNITTENGAKVTINLTNSDWVYCPYTFVLGENITLNVPALFYYAGGAQINGAVITDAYYQRYAGTKLTINEPGSLTVTSETFIIRYTDSDANAGIYVNGDNNDETVGLNLSVAYFYQGMIYAKDANINTSVYWQTNETDGQGSANLVLDNSTLNVTGSELDAKATGNSTITLTNGSSVIIAGGFVTDAELSIDATSYIQYRDGKIEAPKAPEVVDGKIEFVDGEFDMYTNDTDIENVEITYKRTISNKWNAIYLPFEIPASELLNNFDIAYINDVRETDADDDGELDSWQMELIKIKKTTATLKANHPYFIRSKSAEYDENNLSLTLTTTLYKATPAEFECSSVYSTYTIKGLNSLRHSSEFADNERVVGIKADGTTSWGKIAEGYSLKPFRFYLSITNHDGSPVVSSSAQMSIVVRDEDGTTGIDGIYGDESGETVIFDLYGRRVLEPEKGNIYIINGKKVMVK